MRTWALLAVILAAGAVACAEDEAASPGGSGGGATGGSGGSGGTGGDQGLGGDPVAHCDAVDFDCDAVCTHFTFLCNNGCNDGSLDCGLIAAGCGTLCSAAKSAPELIPPQALAAFNCATLESSCAVFAECVAGCGDTGAGGSGGGGGGGGEVDCGAAVTDCAGACADARTVCESGCEGIGALCAGIDQCEGLCGNLGALPDDLRRAAQAALVCAQRSPACDEFEPCLALCLQP